MISEKADEILEQFCSPRMIKEYKNRLSQIPRAWELTGEQFFDFYGKIKDKNSSTYDVNRVSYHILLNNTSKGYWLRVETDNLVISVARGWEILDSFKFSSFDRLTETVYELLKCSEYKDTILVLNNSITLDTLDKLD